jgi:formylglycine-generating enzyme required for sulfatase activity
MGSPTDEVGRTDKELPQHTREIDRTFAIATKETTVEQFLKFNPAHVVHRGNAPEPDCPVNRITYYDAARYCRWLSEQEHIPEDQMCYPRVEEIRNGFRMPEGYLKRTGYRLPTEAEFEAACRAGTVTPRPYGCDTELLPSFAWYIINSPKGTHPVGQLQPNAFGLFDALGNAYERCLDLLVNPVEPVRTIKDVETVSVVSDSDFRVVRGAAFHLPQFLLRSATRNAAGASDPNERVGFRIARTMK